MKKMQYLLGVVASLAFVPAMSQIVIDGSLGGEAGTRVTEGAGFTYDISQGYGLLQGQNLFHSFEEFSVARGESANFSADPAASINHIIGRVTGGAVTTIEGSVSSTIDGASFWFINPAGIVIGRRASLDFSGAVNLSTASYLDFAGQGVFSAVTPQGSGGLTFDPSSFGFLAGNEAQLTLDGASLELAPGQKAVFAAAQLRVLDTEIEAPQGRIAFAAVGSGAETLLSASVPVVTNTVASGTLQIADGSYIDVSGGTGGSVLISGGAVDIGEAYLVSESLGSFDASVSSGTISISGETIVLQDGADIASNAFAENRAANIELNAGQSISITDSFTLLSANPFSPGSEGGDISLNAPSITIDNRATISGESREDSIGGNINIEAEEFVMRGGSNIQLDTSNTSRGGVLSIVADTILVEGSFISADAFGQSTGPAVNIATTSLSLSGGAEITAQTEGGSGAGININAADSVVVNNNAAIATESFGGGPGADITINTATLVLDSGGQIDSSALNTGPGGAIEVSATNTVSVSGSSDLRLSEISAKSGDIDREEFLGTTPGYAEGRGGSISLVADSIKIFDGGRVTSAARGSGSAGRISLGANRLDINGAAVATSAPQSAGGNIGIQVVDYIGIVDGSVTASAGGVTPTDDGGNIAIDPELMLLKNAQITATANAGNGGNIDIVAEHIIRDRDTVIDASSKQGIDGDITIDGVVNEVNRIETIEVEYADVTKLLSQRCTVAQLANRSSFVVLGATDTAAPSTGVYQMAPMSDEFSGSSFYDASDPLLVAELSLLGCPE